MSGPGIPAVYGGEDVNYWFLRNQPCFVQAQEGKARPRHLCAIVHIRIHVGEWDRPRSIPNRVAPVVRGCCLVARAVVDLDRAPDDNDRLASIQADITSCVSCRRPRPGGP